MRPRSPRILQVIQNYLRIKGAIHRAESVHLLLLGSFRPTRAIYREEAHLSKVRLAIAWSTALRLRLTMRGFCRVAGIMENRAIRCLLVALFAWAI
jgi:hypothetical protein